MKDYLDIIKTPKLFNFFSEKLLETTIGFFIGTGGIMFLIASAFSYIGIPNQLLGFDNIKLYTILFFIGVFLCISLFKRFHIPKNYNYWNKKQKEIGIIIAIDDKGEFLGFNLKQDFINEMKANLDNEFKLIILPKQYIKKLNKDRIKELNDKIKGHYWIYGKTERESSKGVEKCFIETEACVIHDSNISDIVQQELSTDFSRLYAGNVSFAESWYRDGTKFTGNYSAVIAKYIIGVAFLISGRPFAALKMHKTLHEKFQNIQKQEGVDADFDENYARKIAEKIKVIQYHEYRVICNYFYYKKDVESWGKYLEEWSTLSVFYGFIDDYSILTQKAIYTFIVKKDIGAARQLIKSAGQLSHNEGYKYSLVFLDLYNKEYSLARTRMTEILKKKKLYKDEGITVKEVIDFIEDVITQEPIRFEFLYWQALLYYKKNENIPMAWSKINSYISKKGSNSFPYEIYNPRELRQLLSKIMKLK